MDMTILVADRLDKIIDALTYPDEYSINEQILGKIQNEINKFNKQTLDDRELAKLLLAQALVHYQNGRDIEALDCVNASISHRANSQVAHDLLNILSTKSQNKDGLRIEESHNNYEQYEKNNNIAPTASFGDRIWSIARIASYAAGFLIGYRLFGGVLVGIVIGVTAVALLSMLKNYIWDD